MPALHCCVARAPAWDATICNKCIAAKLPTVGLYSHGSTRPLAHNAQPSLRRPFGGRCLKFRKQLALWLWAQRSSQQPKTAPRSPRRRSWTPRRNNGSAQVGSENKLCVRTGSWSKSRCAKYIVKLIAPSKLTDGMRPHAQERFTMHKISGLGMTPYLQTCY